MMARVQALAERIETLHGEDARSALDGSRGGRVHPPAGRPARPRRGIHLPRRRLGRRGRIKLTEPVRFEHVLVSRRCEALEKAIAAGAAPGKLMHLCYGILGLVAAHFVVTEEVVLPYLDKAFDAARFEKVLTPLGKPGRPSASRRSGRLDPPDSPAGKAPSRT